MTSATCGARRPIPARAGRVANGPGCGVMADSRSGGSSGLGLEAAVDQPFAGPLRHVHPGVLLGVGLGGAGTRGVGGLAVVLPCLGDAVALLVLELRDGRRSPLGEG